VAHDHNRAVHGGVRVEAAVGVEQVDIAVQSPEAALQADTQPLGGLFDGEAQREVAPLVRVVEHMIELAGNHARLDGEVGDVAVFEGIERGVHQRARVFDGREGDAPCACEGRRLSVEGGLAGDIGAPVASLHGVDAVGEEFVGRCAQHGRDAFGMFAHHAPDVGEVALDVLAHIVKPALVEHADARRAGRQVQPHEQVDVLLGGGRPPAAFEHIRAAPVGHARLDELAHALQRLEVPAQRDEHHAAFGRVLPKHPRQLQQAGDACRAVRPRRQRRHDRDGVVVRRDDNPLVFEGGVAAGEDADDVVAGAHLPRHAAGESSLAGRAGFRHRAIKRRAGAAARSGAHRAGCR
jgi:hypothetical protein